MAIEITFEDNNTATIRLPVEKVQQFRTAFRHQARFYPEVTISLGAFAQREDGVATATVKYSCQREEAEAYLQITSRAVEDNHNYTMMR